MYIYVQSTFLNTDISEIANKLVIFSVKFDFTDLTEAVAERNINLCLTDTVDTT